MEVPFYFMSKILTKHDLKTCTMNAFGIHLATLYNKVTKLHGNTYAKNILSTQRVFMYLIPGKCKHFLYNYIVITIQGALVTHQVECIPCKLRL